MRQILANLARKILGPCRTEAVLRESFHNNEGTILLMTEEIRSRRARETELLGILYRPNEKIEAIRQPLLDAITSSQGKAIFGPPEIEGGEPMFVGLGPPDIGEIKQKIEIALNACQKAIKEQTRGVEPEAEDGSEAT